MVHSHFLILYLFLLLLSRHCVSPKTIVSIVFGVFIGCYFNILMSPHRLHNLYWTSERNVDLPDLHLDHDLDGTTSGVLDIGTHAGQGDTELLLENSTVADRMFTEVKILCWIMTSPKNHQKKAIHVLKTWGKRCNKLLFMSSAKDEEIDSIPLPVKEGRKNLWAKTKESFKYIYENHLNEYDWFLKADDDTYVIVENLRYLLYPYSAETPIYFGCRFKVLVKQGYMSGGAGYVLSREAVRRFVEIAIPDKDKCRQSNNGNEDVEIGRCLENVQVVAGDARDSNGKGRFFPFQPDRHLIPDRGAVRKDYWYYETEEGMECCSVNAISFHYIKPDQMYVFDYLIYRLRTYGIVGLPQRLPHKVNLSQFTSVETEKVYTGVKSKE